VVVRDGADPTDTERVHEALKAEILANALPPGSLLRQAELANRLNTSRTPIREAILRLAMESLVELSPRRGARVVHLSLQDYLEVNQMRWVLEGFAARLAAEHIPLADLAKADAQLAAFEDGNAEISTLAAIDQMVHRLIARYANNTRMARSIEQLNAVMAVARISDIAWRRDEMVASLREIVAALKARDGDAAQLLMQDHIRAFAGQIPRLVSDTTKGRTGR
jgi:DNA-binding GntR family transcriptional regulator